MGAPHDSILLEDLALADLRPYRLVIFLNAFHLTASQRTLIRRRVLHSGRTVLWCYAPGLFNGRRTSPEAMRELTGLRLVPAAQQDPVRARILLTPAGRGLGREATSATLPSPASVAPPPVIGHPDLWVPPIAVDDPEALALGHLEGRTEVALASRPMPGWMSVYTMNPVLPAAFLRALARSAGVPIYNDRDDTLYASRSYLTVSADGPGLRHLQLPHRCDVLDPFTGETLGRGVTRFEHLFQAGETVIWRLA